MAILALKDNPPSKPFNCSILDVEGTWWVANVKPRQEKAFAFDLLEESVNYYLPFYEKKTKRSDGKFIKSYLVLFPSYVPFISTNPQRLYKNNRVVNFIPIIAQVKFRTQLNQIYLANNCGLKIEPVPSKEYQQGNTVRIISGPFAGQVGKIMVIKNSRSVIINIESLGCVNINLENNPIETSTIQI